MLGTLLSGRPAGVALPPSCAYSSSVRQRLAASGSDPAPGLVTLDVTGSGTGWLMFGMLGLAGPKLDRLLEK